MANGGEVTATNVYFIIVLTVDVGSCNFVADEEGVALFSSVAVGGSTTFDSTYRAGVVTLKVGDTIHRHGCTQVL